MAQIDASSLDQTFDAFDPNFVSFNTGTATPFSYSWTSNSIYKITALGYLGDFTPGLTGTVHGINLTDSGFNPMVSILGLNNPLTSFIDSSNAQLNHEKFWDTVLAGETEVISTSIDGSSLLLMGDFVRVATGDTRIGSNDSFTGSGLNGSGGILIGDALRVDAGGTLFGGNDRFINVKENSVTGDVGFVNQNDGNSGVVFGGDDVFRTQVDSNVFINYGHITGDVAQNADGGITFGGDDTFIYTNIVGIEVLSGDVYQTFASNTVIGGDDVILVEDMRNEGQPTFVNNLAGDVYAASANSGSVELIGGDDTITLRNARGDNLSGDFAGLNLLDATIIGGDDTILIEDTSFDRTRLISMRDVNGDAANVTIATGSFSGGDDTIILRNVDAAGVTGGVSNFTVNSNTNEGSFLDGNDIITITDSRNFGNLVDNVSGDARFVQLTGSNAFFGNDTISVTSDQNRGGTITIFGDAESIALIGGETIDMGEDTITFSGGESVTIYGDSIVYGTKSFGNIVIYDGYDVLVSGAGDDTLFGDSDYSNFDSTAGLPGNVGGNDTLDGGLGDDMLFGGFGSDTASFTSVDQSVMVFLEGIPGGSGYHAIGQGSDTFDEIENVTGSSRNDVIVGDSFDNVIEGGAGADNMVGNGGTDTVSYRTSTGWVNVSLATGFVGGGSGSHAIGDTILGGGASNSFFHVIGSDHDDMLSGDGNANIIEGGLGNDTLRGRGAADTLDGGEGEDWIDYADNISNINVSLATGFANGGVGTHSLGDVFKNIENVRGSNFGDRITGDNGDNVFEGRSGSDTLFGGGGSDTADYASSGSFVNISLQTGFVGGGAGSHAIGDTFSSIENLRGSDHNDRLTGNGGDNILRGGAGGDVLNGNGGSDTADYTDSAGSVNVSLLTGFANGGTGNYAIGDTFSSIENLIGSRFGDILNGSNGNNVLEGLAGGDTLRGNGGIDTASYASSDEGVTVSLATNFTRGGHAAGDTFISIENVIGSQFEDFLNGDSANNVLHGGEGNDLLRGRLGADRLDGGSGLDTADYGDASGAVNVSLNSGYVAGSHAAGDVFVSIEGLNGSRFNDVLSGDGGKNVLNGGLGNDSLRGFGGNDVFVFDTNFGNDTIGDFEDEDDGLDFRGNTQVNGVADLTVTTIGADALVADAFGNTILILGAGGDISGSDFLF